MARKPRNFIRGELYHITARALNHESIFLHDEDFEKLLSLIKEVSEKAKILVLGLAALNDHYHILVIQRDDPEAWTISKMMQHIKKRYTVWYNKQHGRGGTLYQDRFHADHVGNEHHMLNALRYVHNNPVKAGITKDAAGYKWSSYADYIAALNGVGENGEYPEKSGFISCRKMLNLIRDIGYEFVSYTNETNEKLKQEKARAERAAKSLGSSESGELPEFSFFDYERKQYRCDTKIAEVLYNTYKISAHEVFSQPHEKKRQIIDYMHFDENVSLTQLSRVVGITVYNLKRILHGINVTTVNLAERRKKMNSGIGTGSVALRA